ncbi:MAG TPA: metallophosphoesterase [Phycisphaerae bacterium]|nr:metallophosphoesterase [Phycisphaerae bacterium]
MLTRRDVLRALAGGSVCLGFDGALSAGGQGAARPELSFGVVADAQYADAEPKIGRHYRESLTKLAECVAALNARKLDFTVHLGDLIERDFASFAAICPVYEKLSMPHYHVLGNHDFSVVEAEKPKVPRALGLDKLGGGKGFYDLTLGRWRLIVLDGTDISTYARPAGSPGHTQALAEMARLKRQKRRNAAGYNGGLGDEQLRWFAGVLDAAAKADQRVIVFCHMPVFPDDPHNLYNDREVLKLLAGRRNVVAWLAGHNHAGNYGRAGRVHCLTMKGMVQGATNAYGVVEAYADHLKLTGFGREADRTMK